MHFTLKEYLVILFLITSTIIFQGCNNSGVKCPGNSISPFRLGFNRTKDSISNHFNVYSPLLTDSIYNSNTEPSSLEFPVNITSDSTLIYIDFIYSTDSTPEVKVTDIIAFSSTSHSYMEELECGIVTEFRIKRVYYSDNHIDTVIFTYNQINSENVNHVEIYY
jgi:hypothetical protein